jgi:hypothetical protein
MAFGFIKTEVNLPQEYVTAVDIDYPVDGRLTSALIRPKGINRIASIYYCSIFLRHIDMF